MGETKSFKIREMTTDDAAACAAVDKKCFGKRDAWRKNVFFAAALSSQADFFVSEVDGRIIACAGAIYHDDAAEIQTIAVDPDFHGFGIGTQIFSELLAKIRSRGVFTVYLEVRPSNTPAVNLYEHFGFKTVSHVKNYYGNEDALIMLLNLDE